MHDLTRRRLMAATGAAALGGRLMTAAQAQAQGIAPKKGGVLNTILTPEPPVLVLGVNWQGPTQIAASKIYQGMLTYTHDLQPKPNLAESWTISEDKLVYTFHLRQGVKWHDGQPFTADDVIFCITKYHIELTPRSRPIFGNIAEATAPDPHTVIFRLKQPFEPFILMFDTLAAPMVPKHIYDGTDYRTNPANQKPVGTGPFRFVEWQRGSFIRLQRFDFYWKPGQPYLDEIIYHIIPDSQSRALALQTGQVQLTQANDIEPFDVPRFRAMTNLEVEYKGWEYNAQLSWIEINHRVKPLDDKRVRQAMSMALDRDFIVNRLWFGVGKPATGGFASTTRFFDASAKLPPFDPKKAAELLDTAGLKPNAQGIRFTIKQLALPYGEVWTRLAEYFRTSMRKIGIDVVLETTDAGAWSRRIGDWDYETSTNFVSQNGDPSLGVERTYVTDDIKKVTFTNTGGYSNPEVDALFQKARTSADPSERKAAFFAIQKIMIEDVPQIWLMEMAWPTIHETRLHNVIESATGPNSSFDDVFLG